MARGHGRTRDRVGPCPLRVTRRGTGGRRRARGTQDLHQHGRAAGGARMAKPGRREPPHQPLDHVAGDTA